MKTKREMRQIGKRGISVLLLCTMLCVPQNVKAEEVADQTVKTTVNQDKITYPTSRCVWSCDEGIGDDEDLYLYGSHTPKGAKIINLKSSNPKIVKAKIQDKVDIHFTRKNAGTTTLSYDLTWKEKDGTQSNILQPRSHYGNTGIHVHHFPLMAKIMLLNSKSIHSFGNTIWVQK